MTGLPHQIFDRHALATRRRRAERAATPGADFLLSQAVDDLVLRLRAVQRRFEAAIDIGTPTPALTDRIVDAGLASHATRIDVDGIDDGAGLGLQEGSVDLAISAMAFQFVGDLPGLFSQVRRALKPDGLFLAAFAGGETLFELRTALTEAEAELIGGAAPRVAPFVDVRSAGALLQRAGFALPVADFDRLVARYDDALSIMHDLRAMGATNVLVERDRRPLRRSVVARAAAIYAERFADPDGRVRATFDIVSLSGWAPHESQQKPLKPGSAKMRLADALGTTERKAGDEARPKR